MSDPNRPPEPFLRAVRFAVVRLTAEGRPVEPRAVFATAIGSEDAPQDWYVDEVVRWAVGYVLNDPGLLAPPPDDE